MDVLHAAKPSRAEPYRLSASGLHHPTVQRAKGLMVLTTVLLSGMFMVICFVSVAVSQRLHRLASHAQSQSETSKRQSARTKAALAAATAALR